MILFFTHAGFAQSYGLQFSSHEVVQEKRTSLNLTPTEAFCGYDKTEISFDVRFRPQFEIYFGYVIRVITSNNENIDIVYNQKLGIFNFVIGEAFSGVFKIDSTQLFGNWNRFAIRMDKKKQEASFYLNDRFICRGKSRSNSRTCYNISFGANDFERFQTVDVPPMDIKDIRIRDGEELRSHYPLHESQGNHSRDISGKRTGIVKNPVWIKPKHQNWHSVYSFHTKGFASVAFDPVNDIMYVVSVDSLYQYSVRNGQISGIRLSKSRDTLPPGNQSIFYADSNKLYNVYIDDQKLSAYDPESRRWNLNFTAGQLTVYWQANKFISAIDTSLYIVGGYGQLQYKNTVQRYHLQTGKWQVLQPGGDPFMPRYLAALGTNAAQDTAFIIGGYGSATGDQTINPKYNYDLISFSVKDRSFHRLYHLEEPARPFCFANSLVVDSNKNDFYALIYPNNRFNSSLQLVKASLTAPSYRLMGDSIPYLFYDIRSFADLFYSPVSKKLVAVTLYTDKNSITSVRIYTIDFPPNESLHSRETQKYVKEEIAFLLLAMSFVIVISAAALAYFFFYKRKPNVATFPEASLTTVEKEGVAPPSLLPRPEPIPQTFAGSRPASSVFLFGQLEIFDKNGLDITIRLTPLIRELFLLILIYTFREGKGISSEQLYSILWVDKPVKDARNNFSVNLVKLKHILQEVGDCHISKESGKWKFEVVNDSINIDYQNYIALTLGKPVLDKPFIAELMTIIGRGGFLPTVHYNWLDDIKSEVAGQVIDILLNFLPLPDAAHEAEFIVRVAKCIFFFDQLNEEALVYQCRALIRLGRHGVAREAYLKFAKEYTRNYGHDFEKSFAEITDQL